MKGSINDASGTEIRRKRVKPKILRESALDAGLAALSALESSDVIPRPVTITARTLVAEGIESIMRLRNRNVPLLRIYTDMRRASGIRISFATFAGYVSGAAKAKGIKLEKPMNPASMDAGPAPVAPAMTETAGMDGHCDRCKTEAVRTMRDDGKAWWTCPACRALWADEDGRITNKRLAVKKAV